MSTLLQLVNEALRRTGQTEASTLVNAQTPILQTIDFLNETYVEMLHKLRVERLMRTETLSTEADVSSYILSDSAPDSVDLSDVLADSLINLTNRQSLTEVDYTYPLRHDPQAVGSPTHFYRQGGQLHLYPIPDAVYSIQYRYLAPPARLTLDADTTELPESWEPVLVLGTQARLEKFLGEGGNDTYLLYRDGLTQLKSRSPLKPYYRMKGFYRGNA